MASPQASDKFFANNKVTQYDHDPANSTVATAIGWVDMRDYGNFAALCFTSSLGGNGPTAFSIIADSDSDGGSGSNVIIKTHAVGSAPDAVGDYLVLECTAEELAQEGADNSVDLRYVSVKVTCHHTDDEAVVTYIRSEARRAADGLTADTVA